MAGGATQIRIDHQYPHSHLGQDSSGIDRCNCLAFPVHPARKQERFRRGFGLRYQEGSPQHPVGFGSDGKRIVGEHKCSLGSRTVEELSLRAGRMGGRGTAPGAAHEVGDDAEIRQTQVALHLLGGPQRIVDNIQRQRPTPRLLSVPAQR